MFTVLKTYMKLPYNYKYTKTSHLFALHIALIGFLTLPITSCSSVKHQETEPSATLSTPNTTSSPAPITRQELAERALALGENAHNESKYADATSLLQGYLTDYPDAPLAQRDRAESLLAQALVASGQCEKAIPHLKRTIQNEDPTSRNLAVNLLLLADCYEKTGRIDEALAATHEVVPDPAILAKLALPPEELNRKFRKVKAPLDVQVSALLRRARLLASKQDLQGSKATLAKATRLLRTSRGYGITRDRARELSGELALREIEILRHECLVKNPLPTHGDEDLVIKHLDGYYSCAEQGRILLCDVYRLSADLMNDARRVYRHLVMAPGVLAQNLPSPSRSFKNDGSRTFYENELKDLVNRRVQEKINDFSSIQECGLTGIL